MRANRSRKSSIFKINSDIFKTQKSQKRHSQNYVTNSRTENVHCRLERAPQNKEEKEKKTQWKFYFSKNLLESQKKLQEESCNFREVFWAKVHDDLRQMMHLKSNILAEISPPQDVPLN